MAIYSNKALKEQMDNAMGTIASNTQIRKPSQGQQPSVLQKALEHQGVQNAAQKANQFISSSENRIVNNYARQVQSVVDGANRYGSYDVAGKQDYANQVNNLRSATEQLQSYGQINRGSVLESMINSGTDAANYGQYKIETYIDKNRVKNLTGERTQNLEAKKAELQQNLQNQLREGGVTNFAELQNEINSYDEKIQASKSDAEQVLERIRSGNRDAIDQLSEEIANMAEGAEKQRYQETLKQFYDAWYESGKEKYYYQSASDEELANRRDVLQAQYNELKASHDSQRIFDLEGQATYDYQRDANQLEEIDATISTINNTLDARQKAKELSRLNGLASNFDFNETIRRYHQTHTDEDFAKDLMENTQTGLTFLDALFGNASSITGAVMLNEDQQNTYIYLKEKYGDDVARDYWQASKDTVNMNIAETIANSVGNSEKGFVNSALKYPMAALLGLHGAFEGAAQWFVDEPIEGATDYLNQIYSEDSTNDLGGFGEILYSSTYSLGNMAPAIAASAFTGGSSLAMGGTMFVTAGGSSRGEALKEGYSPEQATRYGVLSGLSESLMESVIGAAPAALGTRSLGKVSEVINTVANKKSTRNFLSKMASVLKESSGEAIEEYTQEILNPIYRNITLGEENDFEFYTEDALKAAFSGALMGGAFSGSGMIADYRRTVNRTTNITGEASKIKNIEMQTLIDMEDMFDENSETAKILKEISESSAKTKLFENLDKAYLVEAMEADQMKQYSDAYNSTVEMFKDRMTAEEANEMLNEIEEGDLSDIEHQAMAQAFKDVFVTHVTDYLASFDPTVESAKLPTQSTSDNVARIRRTGADAVIELADGNYADVNTVEFESPEEAIIYKEAAAMENTNDANKLVQYYIQQQKLGKNIEPSRYVAMFKGINQAGKRGLPLNTVKKMAAYNLGLNIDIHKSVLDEIYQSAFNSMIDKNEQNVALQFAEKIGAKVQFVDGLSAEIDGKYYPVNGRYNKETGVIEINKATKQPAVAVLCHEFTHSMKENDPKLYKQYSEKVLEILKENPETFEQLKQTVSKNYKEGDEAWVDELVSMTSEIIPFSEKFANKSKEDKGFFARMKNFIRNFARRFAVGEKGFDEARNTIFEILNDGSNTEKVQEITDLWFSYAESDKTAMQNAIKQDMDVKVEEPVSQTQIAEENAKATDPYELSVDWSEEFFLDMSEKESEFLNELAWSLQNVKESDENIDVIYRTAFKDLQTDYSKDEIKENIRKIMGYLKTNKNISYEDFLQVVSDMMLPIVRESYVGNETYERYEFKGTRAYVPDNVLTDLLEGTGVNNLKELNNRMFKFGVVFTANEYTNGKTSSHFGNELWDRIVQSDLDVDPNLVNDVDRAVAFVEALEKRHENRKIYYKGSEADMMAGELALRVVQDVLTNEQIRSTQVQKYADKVGREKIKTAIAEANKFFDGEVDRLRTSYKEAMEKAKAENKDYRRIIRERVQEKYAKARQVDYVTKNAVGMAKMLVSPTKSKHWDKGIVPYLDQLFDALDVTSNRKNSARNEEIETLFAEAKTVKDRMMYNPETGTSSLTYTDEGNKYQVPFTEIMDQINELLQGRKVLELNSTELKQLNKHLYGLKKLNQSNTGFIDSDVLGEHEGISEAIQESIDDVRSATDHNALNNKYMAKVLNPERYFRMLTGYKDNALMRSVNKLNEGVVRESNIKMQAYGMFNLSDKKRAREFRKLREEWVDVTLGGKTVQITRGMKMAIALHAKNKLNMQHITSTLKVDAVDKNGNVIRDENGKVVKKDFNTGQGGFYIPIKKFYEKGDYNKAYKLAECVIPSVEEINAIAKDFTEFEQEMLNIADEYYNKFSKGIINRISFEIEGIERAAEENYYPMSVASQMLSKGDYDYANGVIADDFSSGGVLTARNAKATKALALNDFTHDLENSIKFTARYGGLAIPMRDFSKLRCGIPYGSKIVPGVPTDTMVNAMNIKTDGEATKYIENLIKDLNGRRSMNGGTFFSKLKNNSAQAILSLNPSVALKQSASFPTAIAELDAKSVMKAITWMAPGRKVDQKLIARFTPLLWERMQGMSSQELAEINTSYKTGLQKGMEKAPALFGWIQSMDVKTVGALWKATEYWVNDNVETVKNGSIGKESDAYYKIVAKKFNQVVQRTQPNYNVMGRPEILRDPNALWRSLMMFKTQPMQNFGILFDSVGEYNAMRKAHKEAIDSNDTAAIADLSARTKAARTKMIRSMTSQFAQTVTFVSFTAIANILLHKMDRYRDDDDELTVASFAEEFGWQFLDSFAGNFAFVDWGEDIAEYAVKKFALGEDAQYYPPSVFGVEQVTDMIQLVDEIGDGMLEGKDVKKKLEKLALSMADLTGVPASNLKKILSSIKETVTDVVAEDSAGILDQFQFHDRKWEEKQNTTSSSDNRVKTAINNIFEDYSNGKATDGKIDALIQQIDSEYGMNQNQLETVLKSEMKTALDEGDYDKQSFIHNIYTNKLGFTEEQYNDFVENAGKADYKDYQEQFWTADNAGKKELINQMAKDSGVSKEDVLDSISGWTTSMYADEYRRADSSRRKEIESTLSNVFGLDEYDVVRKVESWQDTPTEEVNKKLYDMWYKKYQTNKKAETPNKTLNKAWMVEKWSKASASEKEKLKAMVRDVWGDKDETLKDGSSSLSNKFDGWVFAYDGDSETKDEDVVQKKLDSWYDSVKKGNVTNLGIKKNVSGVSSWFKQNYRSATSEAERENLKALAVNYFGYNASNINNTAKNWLAD